MSSLPNAFKKSMAGFLQNLVQKLLGSPGERRTPAEPAPTPASQPPQAAPSANAPSPHPGGFTANGEGIELPLQPILDGLPLELQPRVVQPDARDQVISVPLAAILKHPPAIRPFIRLPLLNDKK